MMPCTGNHYSALMFDTFMPLTGPVLWLGISLHLLVDGHGVHGRRLKVYDCKLFGHVFSIDMLLAPNVQTWDMNRSVENKSSDTFARPEEGILPRWLWGWNSDNHFWKQPLRLTAYVWWPSLADIEPIGFAFTWNYFWVLEWRYSCWHPMKPSFLSSASSIPLKKGLRGIEVQSCYFFSLGSWGRWW